MRIMAKQIIGTKVFTKSGEHLGKVSDFEIDVSSNQNIIKYYTHGELLGLLKEPLIISVNQVIEIKEDRIIVEDTVISEKAPKEKIIPEYSPLPE